MAYFNGDIHGWWDVKGDYNPGAPMTRLYCDECAEASIPLPPKTGGRKDGQRHWDKGFRWAPRYGASCHSCGKDC